MNLIDSRNRDLDRWSAPIAIVGTSFLTLIFLALGLWKAAKLTWTLILWLNQRR